MTMRVLNIMATLDKGGVESTVMEYYRFIDRNKIQFDFLITSEKKGCYEEEVMRLGARIFRRPMRSRNPIMASIKLFNVLRKNKNIIAIHIHNLSSVVSLDTFVAMLMGVKIRIVHSHSALHNPSIIQYLFYPLLKKTTTNWAACSAKAGQSMFGKKAWNDRNNKTLLLNARNMMPYKYNRELREHERIKLRINNRFVLINVGRLDSIKNQMFLLEIFRDALRKNASLFLLIAGEGELHEKLMNKAIQLNIEHSILFLGHVHNVSSFFQAADLFVLPSLREGLPGTAIEAQATGLPCLLSDTISKEAKIINPVEFLSINDGTSIWVESILKYIGYERTDTLNDVKCAGYEINDAVKKLEKLYYDSYAIKIDMGVNK